MRLSKRAGLILAIIMGGLLLGPAAQARASDLPEIIAKVQKVYAKAAGFRADYQKKERLAALAQPGVASEVSESEGVILFGRPDGLRLMESRPTRGEVIFSPQGVWWYDEEKNEAHRYPASDFYASMSPVLDFFAGVDSLEKAFNVTRVVGLDRGQEEAIKLVPRSHESGLDRLEVWVNQAGLIVRVDIFSLVGDWTSYRFSRIEILEEPPAEGFAFWPPEGARIIHH